MKKLREWLCLIIAIAIIMFFLDVTGIGCPILFLTGIPCMGCGMTRACLALLRLDFAAALSFHPLCFLLPVFLVIFLVKNKISKKILNCFIAVFIILFIVVYLVRLSDPMDTIIKINLSDGFFYRIACKITERRTL